MESVRGRAYHNLSVMLGAGVPVVRSLRAAARGAAGPVPRALGAVADDVSSGQALAPSMARHRRVFGAMDVLMVEVGEHSGELAESFQLLAAWYAFLHRIRATVQSGLLLPILLLHAAAVLSPLPAMLLGDIDTTQFVFQVLATIAPAYLLAGAIYAVIRFTPATGPARWLLDSLLLHVPLLGRGVLRLSLSRYCRAFYMLHKAGMPATLTATKAADVAGNAAVRRLLIGAAQSARAGDALWEGFSPRLPPEFLQSWQVAEESGTLEETALRLADLYADGAERVFMELAKWLPRLIYFLVMMLMAYHILTSGTAILNRTTIVPEL